MKCSHYEKRTRCTNEATHWVRYIGSKVPGAWSCEAHAQATLDEYKAKLADGNDWDAIPIDWLGNEQPGELLHGTSQ